MEAIHAFFSNPHVVEVGYGILTALPALLSTVLITVLTALVKTGMTKLLDNVGENMSEILGADRMKAIDDRIKVLEEMNETTLKEFSLLMSELRKVEFNVEELSNGKRDNDEV